jgi:hypothetical protein
MMWELSEGVALVRAIQTRVREFGYHVALGGGVLNRGGSDKDLDLYFHPMCNEEIKEDYIALVDFLRSIWGEAIPLGQDYGAPHHDVEDYDEPPVLEYRANQLNDWEQPFRLNRNNPFWDENPPIYKIKKPKEVYKLKVKFVRGGGDRIDVFIV